MPALLTLRIFVSSAGDVAEERGVASRAIDRLQLEFADRAVLRTVLWEHEPLRATGSFQDQIPLPSETDVVVCILWSRLGTRLPDHITRPDGSRYESGTEFEFEDAVRSHRERGSPDLLVYRKTASPVTALDSEERVLERLAQKKALDTFLDRWFLNPDGSFAAASHRFAAPAEFEELIEVHLRKLIEARLADHGAPAPTSARTWPHGSPFRGLRAFGFEHERVFWGRTAAVSDVVDRLRRQAARGAPFTVVIGASGCGKSSLVSAGVLPALTSPGVIEGIGAWRRAVTSPSGAGGDPFAALAGSLTGADGLPEIVANGTGAAELAGLLRDSPQAAVSLVRAALRTAARAVQRSERLPEPPRVAVALVLDQLEELFTLARTTLSERGRWLEAVSCLAASGDVWVLATLRSDYYEEAAALPEFLQLKGDDGHYDLLPPDAAEIGQIIRKPARMAGLQFDAQPERELALDEVLRDEAAAGEHTLPLLEFVLDELFARRTEDGLLTFAAFDELGGLQGAVATRAEAVFEGLSADAMAAFDTVFAGLVRLDPGPERRAVRRQSRVDAFRGAGAELVDAFVAARLFVADRTADGGATVAVAHEALLERWPRLARWIGENAGRLRTLGQISAAAAVWDERGRSADLLLGPGPLLEEGRALLAAGSGDPSDVEHAFLSASGASVATARARRRGLLVAAAAVAAVVLGAAWWALDAHYWIHVEHYANTVERWGVREGIGLLTAEEVRQREFSHRVSRRGRDGPVVRVELVNGHGHLAQSDATEAPLALARLRSAIYSECVWEFQYDGDGALTDEIAYDVSGNVQYVLHYPRKLVDDATCVAEFKSPKGLVTSRAPSGAALLEFTRDDDGLDRQMRFLDPHGEPVPDENGVYGRRFEYDARGLLLERVDLGPDAQPLPARPRVRHDYDARGAQVRVAFFDGDGAPVLLDQDYHALVTEHDEFGNKTELRYLDVDGALILTRDGYAIQRATYDGWGNRVTEANFGTDGEPVCDRTRGVSFARVRHDGDGWLLERALFGVDGEPVADQRGVHRYLVHYGEGRQIAGGSMFGVDGRTLNSDGVHEFRVDWGEHGQPTRVRAFGTDGAPCFTREGFFEALASYDDRGNKVEELLFGPAGERVDSSQGVSGLRAKFDRRNNRTEERYFQVDGSPGLHKDGHHGFRSRFDARGHEVERVTFGVDDEPVRTFSGFARWRASYDSRGRLLEKRYYAPDGSPTTHIDGNHGLRIRRDEHGLPVEEEWFGVDERLTAIDGGYARRSVTRDRRGRVVTEACFDAAGKPTCSDGGFHEARFEYDARGNEIGVRYHGVDGEPVRSKPGYHRRISRYDLRDRRIGARYQDETGAPTHDVTGAYGYESRFDERSLEVERTYVGRDDEPVATNDGYARWVATIDARRNQVEQRYFAADGSPARHRDGNHGWTREYDERGRIVSQTYFGLDGRPLVGRGGYATEKTRRDTWGAVSAFARFDAEGRPARAPEGHHEIVFERDARGRVVETSYRDIDGAAMAIDGGCYRRVQTRDEHGNVTELWCYDERGDVVAVEGYVGRSWKCDPRGNELEFTHLGLDRLPAATRSGYARWRSTYDDVDNLVERRYFDAVGEPVLHAGGSHATVWIRDSHGNEIETAYRGLGGEPVVADNGRARITREFDAHDRLVRTRRFGAADEPVAGERGFHRADYEYDERGNRIRAAFFGVDDEPVLTEGGEHGYRARHDVQGNEVEREYFGVDGEPIATANGAFAERARYDHLGNVVELVFLDAAGQPLEIVAGNAGWTAEYDAHGRMTKQSFFDASRRPVRLANARFSVLSHRYDLAGARLSTRTSGYDGSDGYSSVVERFDAVGRTVEKSFLDGDGRLTVTNDGFARLVLDHDADGNVVGRAFFDAAGGPARYRGYTSEASRFEGGRLVWRERRGYDGESGYVSEREVFDERGNLTEHVTLAVDGAPVACRSGYARWVARYDAAGRPVEEAFFGPAGESVDARWGPLAWDREAPLRPYARWTASYDEHGNVAAETYFGSDGTPVRAHPLGCSGVRRVFNDHGIYVEQVRWDVADSAGYWADEARYDDLGRLVGVRYFDEEGGPALHDDGNHGWREEFDGDSSSTLTFLDLAGQPVRIAGGFASMRRRWGDGRLVELRYLDVDGRPALHLDGNHGYRLRYDEHGNEVERAFFDVHGELVDVRPGFARIVRRFDAAGELVEESHYDAAGRKVN